MPRSSADVLRRLDPRLSAALAARAEAWSPTTTPALARPAASVVLVREAAGSGALETYLLHRHARMAFAPSMVVFPGGRMDPDDQRPDRGPDPWRACAVRETAEETGVVLGPDDLLPWAEWTTPEFEPRRYRTRFYVAALPSGQEAADLSGETDAAEWAAPADALARADDHIISLLPPTRSILLELAELADLDAVLGAATDRVVVPVLPELVREARGWSFRYPSGSGPS